MDLLRGMLVFAGTGLDSMLKQLIRDALPVVAVHDRTARKELETFTERHLRRSSGEEDVLTDTKFLAAVLVAENPRDRILEAYVQDLTRGSLQSPSELHRATKALGIDPAVFSPFSYLAQAFEVRNQIVHELDINFDHAKRNRQTRAIGPMLEMTNAILSAAATILALSDDRLIKGGA
jgi:hypothetical protein